jgi:hypothetical protein
MKLNVEILIYYLICLFGVAGLAIGFAININFYTDGAKNATNQTTIECIETPEKCKQRYEYLKLREKLGEY